MIANLCLALVLQSDGFTETYLKLPGDDYEAHVADLDGDGRDDLLLSLLDGDRRRLELHRQDARGGFPGEPSWSMSLPPDVVSFALLDVREDPGLEVLLLSGSGVFSVSTARVSLRDNLRQELALSLFPDLAGAGVLPRWQISHDLDGDGDQELLVCHEGHLLALAVRPAPESGLHEIARVACLPPDEGPQRSTFNLGGGAGGGNRGLPLLPFFPGSPSSRSAFPDRNWLTHRGDWRLPRFVDWNRDGRADALFEAENGFLAMLQDDAGHFAVDRPLEITMPAAIEAPEDANAGLVDLDGDGRLEFTVTRNDDEDHLYLVFPRQDDGRIEEAPCARVKLSGIGVSYDTLDLDGDGHQELIALSFDLPSGITQASKVRMDLTLQIYRGEPGARLSRRPALRLERSFWPDEMKSGQEAALLDLSGDFDGDGLHDLLLLQPGGVLEITRLLVDGAGWRLADEPRTRYRPPSEITSAEVCDFSKDGLADLLLRHEAAISVFVSHREGGR